jgi:AAA domain
MRRKTCETVPEARRPVLFAPSAAQWIGKEPEPIPFVVEGLIPRDVVTLLVAAGGRGKTMLAQSMMSAIARGAPFLGLPTRQGSAAGIFCEDSENTLHNRQLAICRKHGFPLAEIADLISPTSFVGEDTLLWKAETGATELLDEIEASIAARSDMRSLVIDGAAYVFGASEIDRGEVTRFMARLNGLAAKHQIAVVLITHESKSSGDDDLNAASGSTAWLNAARSVLKLNRVPGQPSQRELVHIKTNLGPLAPKMLLSLEDGTIVRVDQDSGERAAACLALTEAAMRTALANGENRSPSNRADNCAAKRLARECAEDGFTEAEFKSALDALVTSGRLRVEEYKNNGKPAKRYALGEHADGSTPTVTTGGPTVAPEPSEANKDGRFEHADGSELPTVARRPSEANKQGLPTLPTVLPLRGRSLPC